uniref:Uncharacterized protein n=1 Tax=viral metagenome TaxID=1070528 RepID=A0A6C0F7A5_9ZZZZ|tara:strand:- start:22758 stop:23144 length:387 start_codon:yes stop_codon:yes gene_type:complete
MNIFERQVNFNEEKGEKQKTTYLPYINSVLLLTIVGILFTILGFVISELDYIHETLNIVHSVKDEVKEVIDDFENTHYQVDLMFHKIIDIENRVNELYDYNINDMMLVLQHMNNMIEQNNNILISMET